MRHHMIWWLNIVLIALIACACLGAIVYQFSKGDSFSQPPITARPINLPQSPYEMKEPQYQALGTPVLELEFQLPSIRVPDLRQMLVFHGKNLRPDVKGAKDLFFSLGNTNQIASTQVGKPVFISVLGGGGYSFSPNNQPTDLWFEAKPVGNGVQVSLSIRDESGKVQQEPKDKAFFTLTEKPLTGQALSWNLDKWRVDGTLLMRQGAKWTGRDLFLEEHGGPEFQFAQGKQRILLGEGEDKYSVYVDKGDILIWKDHKWVFPAPNEETMGLPLLQVDKVEERLLSATLFDDNGKHKINLNLIKTADPLPPVAVEKDFHFVGARTRVHSMFKIRNQREVVGPHDWFLLTPDGWKKIKTGKEIDSYVEGKATGPLLVINRLEKEHENKWLDATLYSPLRSTTAPLKLELKVQHPEPKKEIKKEKKVPRIYKAEEEEGENAPPSNASIPNVPVIPDR